MNSLIIQVHCAISRTSNRGLSSASCVRSICSTQQRPMRFAHSWSQCSPSTCASVPVLEKWPTIHGWMWIGTRKRRLLRALRGERIELPRAITVLAPFAPSRGYAVTSGIYVLSPLPSSDVHLRVMAPLPLFFPARYSIGCQLIVQLINITISDALLWNSDSHSCTLHPMSCISIVYHMYSCGFFSATLAKSWLGR